MPVGVEQAFRRKVAASSEQSVGMAKGRFHGREGIETAGLQDRNADHAGFITAYGECASNSA